ncbi:MAG: hypothetical protein NUW37_01310 [Planctomycetes bacterium]|nr:hypothetical protein [Planctomycetota bacterium]
MRMQIFGAGRGFKFALVLSILTVSLAFFAGPRSARADEDVDAAIALARAGYTWLSIEELKRITNDAAKPDEVKQYCYETLAFLYGALAQSATDASQVDELNRLAEEARNAALSSLSGAMKFMSMANAAESIMKTIKDLDRNSPNYIAQRETATKLITEAVEGITELQAAAKKAVDDAWDGDGPTEDQEWKLVESWVYLLEIRYKNARWFLAMGSEDQSKEYESILSGIEDFMFEYGTWMMALRGYYIAGRIQRDMGNTQEATNNFSKITECKIDNDFVKGLKQEVFQMLIEAAMDAGDWDKVISSIDQMFVEFPDIRASEQGTRYLFAKLEAMVNRNREGDLRAVYDEIQPYISSADADPFLVNKAWSLLARIGTLDPSIVPPELVFRGAVNSYNAGNFTGAADTFQNLLGALNEQTKWERFAPELYEKIAECYRKLGRGIEAAYVYWQASYKFRFLSKMTSEADLSAALKEGFTGQPFDEIKSYPARMALEAKTRFNFYFKSTGNPMFRTLVEKIRQEILSNFQSIPEVRAAELYEQASDFKANGEYRRAAQEFISIGPDSGEYYLKAQQQIADCYWRLAMAIRRGDQSVSSANTSDEDDIFAQTEAAFREDTEIFGFLSADAKNQIIGYLEDRKKYNDDAVLAQLTKARFFYSRYFYWTMGRDMKLLPAEVDRIRAGDWLTETTITEEDRVALLSEIQKYEEAVNAGRLHEASLLQSRVANLRDKAFEAASRASEESENLGAYNRLRSEIERTYFTLGVARYNMANIIRMLIEPVKKRMDEIPDESPEKAELLARYLEAQNSILTQLDDFWVRYGTWVKVDSLKPAIAKSQFYCYISLARYDTNAQESEILRYARNADEILQLYEQEFVNGVAEEKDWVFSQVRTLGATLDIVFRKEVVEISDRALIPLMNAERIIRTQAYNELSEIQTQFSNLSHLQVADAVVEKISADLQIELTARGSISGIVSEFLTKQTDNPLGRAASDALLMMIKDVYDKQFAQYVDLENRALRYHLRWLDEFLHFEDYKFFSDTIKIQNRGSSGGNTVAQRTPSVIARLIGLGYTDIIPGYRAPSPSSDGTTPSASDQASSYTLSPGQELKTKLEDAMNRIHTSFLLPEKSRIENYKNRLLVMEDYKRAIVLMEYLHKDNPIRARGITQHANFSPNDPQNKEEFQLKLDFATCYYKIADEMRSSLQNQSQGGILRKGTFPDNWLYTWQELGDYLGRLDELLEFRENENTAGRGVNYDDLAATWIFHIKRWQADTFEMIGLDERAPRNPSHESWFHAAKVTLNALLRKTKEYSIQWWEASLAYLRILWRIGDKKIMQDFYHNREYTDPNFGGFKTEFDAILALD